MLHFQQQWLCQYKIIASSNGESISYGHHISQMSIPLVRTKPFSQNTKSHTTSHVQSPTVPQNTACAVLRRSVARLSSLLPRSTLLCVVSTSLTSCEIYSSCVARWETRVSWREDISKSDFSAFLGSVSFGQMEGVTANEQQEKDRRRTVLSPTYPHNASA